MLKFDPAITMNLSIKQKSPLTKCENLLVRFSNYNLKARLLVHLLLFLWFDFVHLLYVLMCNWKYCCFICSLLKLLLFLCVLLRAMPFTWCTRYKPLIRYVTWFGCRDDTKAVSSKESLDRNRKSRKEVKEEKDSKRRMRSASSEDDKARRKQRDESERLVPLLSQPFYPRAYFCWECLSCILDLWGSCPSCSKRLHRE